MRWPIAIAISSVALFATLIAYRPDMGILPARLLMIPLAVMALVIFFVVYAIRRSWIRMGLIALLIAMLWLSWEYLPGPSIFIREEARWLIKSNGWKQMVFAEDPSSDKDLQHVSWDGWGWAFASTEVYLVHSPDDDLRNYSPSHLAGLPCEVADVQKLSKGWYSVIFFTDSAWYEDSSGHGVCVP